MVSDSPTMFRPELDWGYAYEGEDRMPYANILDGLIDFIGILGLTGISLTAIAAATWGFFKFFGAKWLEARFAERMADYQHRQTLQGDEFRSDLAALLDRHTKLHAHEYEILPRVWELLSEAMGSVGPLVSAIQTTPDVTWVSPAELDAALEERPFKLHEKDEIRGANRGPDRQKVYTQFNDKYRYFEAYEAHRAFHNFVVTKGIFIEPDLRAMLQKIDVEIGDILFHHQIMKFEDGGGGFTKPSDIRKKWEPIPAQRDTIQDRISARLWSKTTETAENP